MRVAAGFQVKAIAPGPKPLQQFPPLFQFGTSGPFLPFRLAFPPRGTSQSASQAQVSNFKFEVSNLTSEIGTPPYSHSIVLGGFELTSYTTRLIPLTSFTIRVEIRSRTSAGRRVQSAVIASSDSTTRTAIVNP